MPENEKGLNRGGIQGQEGELGEEKSQGRQSPEGLGQRNQQKPQGGINREPNLEKKKDKPETHVVD